MAWPDYIRQVLTIYNNEYASSYDSRFLNGGGYGPCTEFELELLKELIDEDDRWLDVGCGTGFHLSKFPHVERMGLDIAPAMLRRAKARNRGVKLLRGDFRERHPELRDSWSIVTSFWYAYTYLPDVVAVDAFIENLACWTAPGGLCLLPVLDPSFLLGSQVNWDPDESLTPGGKLRIRGVVWDWIDTDDDTNHSQLVAPTVEFFQERLQSLFSSIETIEYPRFEGDWMTARIALLARHA